MYKHLSKGLMALLLMMGVMDMAKAQTAEGPSSLTEGRFKTCLPGGCVSVIELAVDGLDKFAAGNAATVAMRDTGNQDIALNVSLAGFTAAWNRLKGL